MIKAIFFDIDGTLLNQSGHALKSTREAIAAAHAKGILVGVATGRGPYRLNSRLDNVDLDIFVTYNGQLVYSPKRTWYAEPFDQATLAKFIAYAEDNQRQMLFGSRYQVFGSRLLRFSQTRTVQKLFRLLPRWFPVFAFKKVVTKIKNLAWPTKLNHEKLLETPIYQVVMLSPMGELAMLKKQFPECHFTRSNKLTVDIIPAGGSKINGIKKVIEPFEITLDEVMVFGDSWNDSEMLQAAGIGVAMGNAPKAVQNMANYVTKTNDADGIYAAFEHFGLIEKPEEK